MGHYSNLGNQPTIRKIQEANKAVKKLKENSSNIRIAFPGLGAPSKIELVCFSDASHANLPGNASQGAYIVFIKGSGKIAPLIWQSRKLKRVTKSPLASETLALGEAADAAKLMVAQLVEIHQLSSLEEAPTIHCFTDSKSLYDATTTTNTVEDKSLRVEIARIREMVELKEIFVHWVSNEFMLADVMTKKGASSEILLNALATSKLC